MGSREHDVGLNQQYAIRSVHHQFPYNPLTYHSEGQIRQPLYRDIEPLFFGGQDYHASWLFGGLSESAFGAASPAWSKDSWSFAPVDSPGITTGNATFRTPALSGRLECTPMADNGSWLVIQNLTDSFTWNITKNPTGLDMGYELSDSVRQAQYLSNTASDLIIGQWLMSNWTTNGGNTLTSWQNFTILWIYAPNPIPYYKNVASYSQDLGLSEIFETKPPVQALNCMSVFETADAQITVSVADGEVQDYEILDTPQNATEAWSTEFVNIWPVENHTYLTENPNHMAIRCVPF
jgi:hypothetical protein